MTVLMQAPDGTHLDRPETLLRVRPDAPAGTPIDAIDCAAVRAKAILVILMNQFEREEPPAFSNAVICNALWAVEGMIEQMAVMANHAHMTEPKP